MSIPSQLPSKSQLARLQSYTLLDEERLNNLCRLVVQLVAQGVPGDIVECGVGNGGSAAAMGLALGGATRHLWLYDSFEGMPKPSDQDGPAAAQWEGTVLANQAAVAEAFATAKLAMDNVTVTPGWFENTLETFGGDQIAMLHCDADWYSSVMITLETFYDRVPDGGCVVLDDFGYWEGCRTAFYDFCFKRGERPLLRSLGATQVYWIKGKASTRE